MSVLGYKCFNNDFTNRYGMKFSKGTVYVTKGAIKFGNNGNGFHMCKNIEDTFRYFDAMNKEVKVCFVEGSGKVSSHNDEYYGYYNMYSVEKLRIIKELTREEIINIAKKLNQDRLCRFVSLFRLTNEEINYFKNKNEDDSLLIKTIEYYQENKKDVFKKR